jgi:AbiJ N-terminal domain 3
MNEISEITRRLDTLRLQQVQWEGRLGESAFLSRVFDLSALPSHDRRASDMLDDVVLHRENFRDWSDDWPYDDGRLDLLRGPDHALLHFPSEMMHPIVRDDDAEVDRLLEGGIDRCHSLLQKPCLRQRSKWLPG